MVLGENKIPPPPLHQVFLALSTCFRYLTSMSSSFFPNAEGSLLRYSFASQNPCTYMLEMIRFIHRIQERMKGSLVRLGRFSYAGNLDKLCLARTPSCRYSPSSGHTKMQLYVGAATQSLWLADTTMSRTGNSGFPGPLTGVLTNKDKFKGKAAAYG